MGDHPQHPHRGAIGRGHHRTQPAQHHHNVVLRPPLAGRPRPGNHPSMLTCSTQCSGKITREPGIPPCSPASPFGAEVTIVHCNARSESRDSDRRIRDRAFTTGPFPAGSPRPRRRASWQTRQAAVALRTGHRSALLSSSRLTAFPAAYDSKRRKPRRSDNPFAPARRQLPPHPSPDAIVSDGYRCSEVAHRDSRRMPPSNFATPPAVIVVLTSECANRVTRPIRDLQVRGEVHDSSGLADPQVQLPILGTFHRFVVPAHALQCAAPKATEVHGQSRSLSHLRRGRQHHQRRTETSSQQQQPARSLRCLQRP